MLDKVNLTFSTFSNDFFFISLKLKIQWLHYFISLFFQAKVLSYFTGDDDNHDSYQKFNDLKFSFKRRKKQKSNKPFRSIMQIKLHNDSIILIKV